MLVPSQGGLIRVIGTGKVKLHVCSINHYTMQVYRERRYGSTHT